MQTDENSEITEYEQELWNRQQTGEAAKTDPEHIEIRKAKGREQWHRKSKEKTENLNLKHYSYT